MDRESETSRRVDLLRRRQPSGSCYYSTTSQSSTKPCCCYSLDSLSLSLVLRRAHCSNLSILDICVLDKAEKCFTPSTLNSTRHFRALTRFSSFQHLVRTASLPPRLALLQTLLFTDIMADLRLRISNSGFTSLVGDFVDSIASKFTKELPSSGHSLHITLLTRVEARELKERNVVNPFVNFGIESKDLVVLGLGSDRGAKFVVVLINKVNILRLKNGLPTKNFHISLSTLAGTGPEDVYHGIETLLVDPLYSDTTSLSTLDTLALHHLLRKDNSASLATSVLASSRFPSSPQPFLRIADAAFRLDRYKLAMVAYARTFDLTQASQASLRDYAIKQIGRCSRFTEWGPTYLERERPQFDDIEEENLKRFLVPWSEELKTRCTELSESLDAPVLSIESRERVNVQTAGGEYKLQRFFVSRAHFLF